MKVSIFNGAKDKTPIYEESLVKMLEGIRTGVHAKHVEKIRKISDKKTRQTAKESLPSFTVSGTFEKGEAKGLLEHSNFIALDIDGLEDLDTARAVLYADRYVYAGFVSVSGRGLCLIVRIEGSRHRDAYDALEKHFWTNYKVNTDPSCKDVSRLRYTSHDPDLYFNEDAPTFKEYLPKEKPKRITPIITGEHDLEYLLSEIESRRIDLTVDYKTWVKIGMAIKSHLGDFGENAFHRVSQFHPDYDYNECSKKYGVLPSDSQIKIATLFWHAKDAGVPPQSPKTKHIIKAAVWGKKSVDKRTPEDVAETLRQTDSIPPEVSLPVIQQVYASATPIKTDETTSELVADYVRSNYPLKYNALTLKYEKEGQPLSDRDVNSIYLQTKAVYPEASKELVWSIIDSNETAKYSPVQEFFKGAPTKGRGLIAKLAACIQTPMNAKLDGEPYAEYFIKRWMVGAVAMWHGEHSPLMLILAGTQQNTGKTHFFRNLLPKELQSYYAEAELTGDKDENLLMCSKIILMNDEMSNKSKRDITVVKQLCSKRTFTLRKAYGRVSEDFARVAALAGTSNDLSLLQDPTGNRRFIPIEVHGINHAGFNAIDKAELWGEAYALWRNGYKYELDSKGIAFLNSETLHFEQPTPEAELLAANLGLPDRASQGSYMTNTQIKVVLERRSDQRLSSKKLGEELRRMGFVQEIVKADGKTQRVYRVLLYESPLDRVVADPKVVTDAAKYAAPVTHAPAQTGFAMPPKVDEAPF